MAGYVKKGLFRPYRVLYPRPVAIFDFIYDPPGSKAIFFQTFEFCLTYSQIVRCIGERLLLLAGLFVTFLVILSKSFFKKGRNILKFLKIAISNCTTTLQDI